MISVVMHCLSPPTMPRRPLAYAYGHVRISSVRFATEVGKPGWISRDDPRAPPHPSSYPARTVAPRQSTYTRAVVNRFVDDWGEDMLGPLAEPFLSGSGQKSDEHGGSKLEEGGARRGVGLGVPIAEAGNGEGLSDLWPRLSRIHEGMEDLEASRTKVELARQLAVERSNPESIARALDKAWP